ncbi:hypothetical protein KSF_066710 [Reticulibacter mediterranei]|uniref:Uncharacterized protein n=1 Tax=Reticulibacter mediterranei TaxID=2778369 RepID=A0A8J3N5L6_9CHLR|nr:PQQ-like beta-propeller repeat protein [Reticulibacter mediterranei]GHO96623.1 hypothetical protein KSF_066710 [Reticulibacter mediterranei]
MLLQNNPHDRKKIPWLRLTLFVLLLAIGSGTLLILHPLQTHAIKHYLLSGKTVFAFEGGRKLWQRTLPGFNSSFPSTLLIEDRLYIAAGPVYALDKETGKILWQRHIPLVAAFFTQEQIATSLFS